VQRMHRPCWQTGNRGTASGSERRRRVYTAACNVAILCLHKQRVRLQVGTASAKGPIWQPERVQAAGHMRRQDAIEMFAHSPTSPSLSLTAHGHPALSSPAARLASRRRSCRERAIFGYGQR